MVLTRFSLNVSLITGVHYQLPAAISFVLSVSQKPWKPMEGVQSAGRRSTSRMPSKSMFERQQSVGLIQAIIKQHFTEITGAQCIFPITYSAYLHVEIDFRTISLNDII